MPLPAPAANALFSCAYCDGPVSERMRFCPRCGLRLDSRQVALRRFNVLLAECGSWQSSGEVPEPAAGKLLERYTYEYDAALRTLAASSPGFRPAAVPVASQVQASAPPAAPVLVPHPPPAVPSPSLPADESAPVIRVQEAAGGRVEATAPRAIPDHGRQPGADPGTGLTSETGLAWLANAGIFAVFVAIVLLVRNHWGSFDPGARILILASGAAAAMGLGGFLRRTLLHRTGSSVLTIGALSVPVVFASAAWFLPDARVSTIGVTGGAVSGLLYYALSFASGLRGFRWLGAASAACTGGFLLGVLEVPLAGMPYGMMLVGAAFGAATLVFPRQEELRVSAVALQAASLAISFPAAGATPFLLGLCGHAAAVATLAALARRTPALWHPAWISLGIGAWFLPFALHADAPAFAASFALAASVPILAWLTGRAEFRDLAVGGAVLLGAAAISVVRGYQVSVDAGNLALLTFGALSIPTAAWAAWKRDHAGWAIYALALAGAMIVPGRARLAVDPAWLPVAFGSYAALLFALRPGAGAFHRSSAAIGLFAHGLAFLLAAIPEFVVSPRLGIAMPFYWNDLAWRGALALVLPAAVLALVRARDDARWIYLAIPSALGALLFALHGLGVPGEWGGASVAGAALAAMLAGRGSFERQMRAVGLAAGLCAILSGFLLWSELPGVTALLAAAAVCFGCLPAVRRGPLAVGTVLAALAAWSFAAGHLPGQNASAVAALALVPAVAAGFLLSSREDREEVALGAAGVSGVAIAFLLATPSAWIPAGALLPAGIFAALAVAAWVQATRSEGVGGWTGAGAVLAVGAGYFGVLRLQPPALWHAPLLTLVPLALAAIARARLTRPSALPLLVVSGCGLAFACAISTRDGQPAFATTLALSAAPALVFALRGPGREGHALLSATLCSASAALFCREFVHDPAWVHPACAAVPALFCALGAWTRFLPQGRWWSATGGVALGVALAASLAAQNPLAFGLTALVAASGAAAAIAFAPAALAGTSAFLFNAAMVAFFLHAEASPHVAGPCLMALAALEGLAASFAGARATAHAVFSASGSLVLGALAFAGAGIWGSATPDLVPAMAAVGVLSASAAVLAAVRRQSYLVLVAILAAAGEYFLILAHAGVSTLEFYTFPPAAVVLLWTHLAARREIRIVSAPDGRPALEARLSGWAQSLADSARHQGAQVRTLAILAALGPSGRGALAWEGGVHVPCVMLGGAAVLIAGVLDRRKVEAMLGATAVVGVAAWKGVQWMLLKEVSAAWWILMAGAVLLAVVAALEVRRSWFLKERGAEARRLLEAYLSRWR